MKPRPVLSHKLRRLLERAMDLHLKSKTMSFHGPDSTRRGRELARGAWMAKQVLMEELAKLEDGQQRIALALRYVEVSGDDPACNIEGILKGTSSYRMEDFA